LSPHSLSSSSYSSSSHSDGGVAKSADFYRLVSRPNRPLTTRPQTKSGRTKSLCRPPTQRQGATRHLNGSNMNGHVSYRLERFVKPLSPECKMYIFNVPRLHDIGDMEVAYNAAQEWPTNYTLAYDGRDSSRHNSELAPSYSNISKIQMGNNTYTPSPTNPRSSRLRSNNIHVRSANS
jgi:hypothetical protein